LRGLIDPLFPRCTPCITRTVARRRSLPARCSADRVLDDGRMKNVVMIGDGGATIGLVHLAQAALDERRSDCAAAQQQLYGMTGGQHSGLTPEGFVTSTTLGGNRAPHSISEQLLGGCHAAFSRESWLPIPIWPA
jgi:pyruvate/2-oxoacid:ferredoxin oxidoreductase beta subunit